MTEQNWVAVNEIAQQNGYTSWRGLLRGIAIREVAVRSLITFPSQVLADPARPHEPLLVAGQVSDLRQMRVGL